MAPARPVVFLHIGAMKTGTTFLQHLMSANQSALADAGYLFPGESWARQVRATQEILHLTQGDPRIIAEAAGAWSEVAEEMLAHQGEASILSMEFLSFAGHRGAARVVRSLRGADVHVVLTVRDGLGTIPAWWQTETRNGGVSSWPDATRAAAKCVRRGRFGGLSRDPAVRSFHRSHGIDRMLRAWGRTVPRDRLHVVTVPPSGSPPMLLWERFAAVVGVDPAVCTEPSDQTNASLGYASVELMRLVNLEVGPLRPTDYNSTLKTHLARALAGRADTEQRATLDLATQQLALDWNRRVRAAVVASGASVTGDLDDLPTRLPQDRLAPRDRVLERPDDKALLAAAASAVDGMRGVVRRRAGRLRRRNAAVPAALPNGVDQDGPTSPEHWNDAPDPVRVAVEEVAELARAAVDLNRRLRETL